MKTSTPIAGMPGTPEHVTYLTLQRVALQHQYAGAELLREFELSGPQFNVLRILRGAPEGGLPCSQIGERLLVHDPDVTRLLDRLEKQGHLRRERASYDRRVVLSRLTEQGHAVLQAIDQPLAELHAQQFAALSPEQLADLERLLQALLPPPTPEETVP